MNILLTHPGTQYVYALAAALQQRGYLYRFATGLAFGSQYGPVLPGPLRRRVVAGVPDSLLYRLPLPEVKALLRLRMGANAAEVLQQRNLHFQQKLPQRLIAAADAVIGFDTSSWILIERCRKAGKKFVLDASIAHPLEKELIYQQLREQFPAWQQELAPKTAGQIALEQQEMEEADVIVAATQFTQQSLVKHGVAANKIVVNPYGTDLQFFASKWDTAHANPHPSSKAQVPGSRPVTFVFLGTINARKGIPWLCRVWPQLRAQYPNSRLLLGGYGKWPTGFALPQGIELCGFILPQHRADFLQQADVFVFPSYFEGFAQVIIEAMATGLPIITTAATVGPEIMKDGQAGFLLQPGDDEGLLRSMLHFCRHPEAIAPMGRAAREAVLPFTWEAYGQRWQQLLQAIGNPS